LTVNVIDTVLPQPSL
jgi:hypothetical protein